MGLTILQGPPGTGKTFYLRYLVHELRSTRRFYYMPVTGYPLLRRLGHHLPLNP